MNLASPNNPLTTRIVTSRLSLQEQIDIANSPEERSLLVEEEEVLDEEDALKALEAELEEKETELRALETLRTEAQGLERVESLRDQVMEAAVKLGVVSQEEVSREHPVVVAELDRILAFAPKEEFPEAIWKPTEEGDAGHWLRQATSVPPLEFPKEESSSSSTSDVDPSSNPTTPSTNPLAEARDAKKTSEDAKRASEASGSHRPIDDSSLLPLPVLLAEPAPDYSRSPLVTLFSTDNPIDSFPIPTFIGYLLTEADRRFLFNTLPHVTAQKDIMPLPGVKLSQEDMQRRVERAEEAMEGERKSLEALARILNLKNASSRLIMKENRRRVIEAFGQPEVKSLKTGQAKVRKGPDSGSAEVQGQSICSCLFLLDASVRPFFSTRSSFSLYSCFCIPSRSPHPRHPQPPLALHEEHPGQARRPGHQAVDVPAQEGPRVPQAARSGPVRQMPHGNRSRQAGSRRRADYPSVLVRHSPFVPPSCFPVLPSLPSSPFADAPPTNSFSLGCIRFARRQVLPRGKYSRNIKFVGKVGKMKRLVGRKKINPRSMGGMGKEAYY